MEELKSMSLNWKKLTESLAPTLPGMERRPVIPKQVVDPHRAESSICSFFCLHYAESGE